MKKLFAMLLAVVMMMSLATVAFAEGEGQTPTAPEYQDKLNVNASFVKKYDLTNEDNNETSPAEDFVFEFEFVKVEEAEEGVTTGPDIADATAHFDALTADDEVTVTVPLNAASFPGIGVYTYKITEKAGNTAGVVYNTNPMFLVVTVLRDEADNGIKYVAAVHYVTEDGSKQSAVTNTYKAGSLEVKKTVSGNMAEKDRHFKMTVTFNSAKPVREVITINACVHDGITNPPAIATTDWTEVKSGETVTGYTATAVIYLQHDDTVEFENIPYGVTYTVVEDDYTSTEKGGYDEATGEVETATSIDKAVSQVTINNHKDTTVDTGILMDSAPYVVMLLVAAAGLVLFTNKRRVQD